ncbi:EAL domain-containing protein [Pseudahrensia aquimaris]|uniref:EAL domain-containing protein n=1 Tax=Pseudahrensia aquimaris TaxID=744461 RepID=A0ABW3F9W0_9HYPH
MNRFKPTLFISFGLVSLTLALTLTAYLFGLLPDGHRAELDSRAKVAEALAVQLASAANQDNPLAMQETMRSVVERNDDVFSTAFRNAQGKIVFSHGDHEKHWMPVAEGRSTPTHVSVPLLGADGKQGTIEISFSPPTTGAHYFGIPGSLLTFLAFIMICGFAGYFFILRRSLKELDPSRVIPERVQKAFDTLSEGVLILDERERILLVNASFAGMYDDEGEKLVGAKINNLPWRMVDGRAIAGGYPWHTALREERETREEALSLRTPSGHIHNFNVNATVIANDKGKSIGAIVTMRDMTNENYTRHELAKALKLLGEKEAELSQQTRELTYLNTHDALSGCLNRRTFFTKFVEDMERARESGDGTVVLMVGIDDFSTINDRFGPATGDKAIIEVAKTLRSMAFDPAYVARYGGDEFCIALPQSDTTRAAALAEALRSTVSRQGRNFLPAGEAITISIGVAILEQEKCTAHELVHRASHALNAARSEGTSQIKNWDGLSLQLGNKASDDKRMRETSNASAPSAELALPITSRMSEDEMIQAAAAAAESEFTSTVDSALEESARNKKIVALLHLRIDSWDYLLEALGEPLCELLMRTLKRQIEATLRDQDKLLIVGNTGDMLIALTDLNQMDDVHWMITRMLDSTRKAVDLSEGVVYPTCMIGAAIFPESGQTGEILIRNAGIAMRRACRDKPLSGYLVYEDGLVQGSKARLEIETGIREALENNEFDLSFQPVVCAKTGALTAAEALLRCENSRLKSVRMDHIINTAEQSSLIAEVDMWVIRTALAHMQKWCAAGLQLPKVSINISAKQLSNVTFMDQVYDLMQALPFAPSRVQLEVTETARMADVEIAAPQLKRLQNLGVHIALDDFGTGQASLTYLQRLHPDVIKIDRSFITGVNTNHANATMVSAMTVMAHCLGLKVVVEGVEDEEQLTFLRETRCDEIQGYYISKPLPAKVFTEWLGVFVSKNGAVEHVTAFEDAA